MCMSICAFFYMWNLFGVVVLHRCMVDWRGYLGLRYMCILLYMKIIWCSGFPEIYAQLEEGVGSVCAWVYVHSAICGTYLV